jgi:hypothetical protein
MYKLIGIVLVAIPVILFLRTIFMGQLKRSQAVSDFKKQIDYLVWMILILIGCGLVYSIGKLILSGETLYHFQGWSRSGSVGLKRAPRPNAAGAIGHAHFASEATRQPCCQLPSQASRLVLASSLNVQQ